ncbi:MAG: hypothetical protein QNJ22_16365 [Desulfosarcinaceae bacterium]|nr:hypothetical protein [Desulfosarcinaceae bacterium]
MRRAGVALVFVLGHPDDYPRCGFRPGGAVGFDAPYAIAQENTAAWMVQDLSGGVLGRIAGKVRCARAIDAPAYWRA